MRQKPTTISLIIHKPSTHTKHTKLHFPTSRRSEVELTNPHGLHKEILDSHHLILLFYTRNKKYNILDSSSILISFSNTKNTKTYPSTR